AWPWPGGAAHHSEPLAASRWTRWRATPTVRCRRVRRRSARGIHVVTHPHPSADLHSEARPLIRNLIRQLVKLGLLCESTSASNFSTLGQLPPCRRMSER